MSCSICTEDFCTSEDVVTIIKMQKDGPWDYYALRTKFYPGNVICAYFKGKNTSTYLKAFGQYLSNQEYNQDCIEYTKCDLLLHDNQHFHKHKDYFCNYEEIKSKEILEKRKFDTKTSTIKVSNASDEL